MLDIYKMTKRLGVFVFYDASGIVDDYVEELLKSLVDELNKLVIVVNGLITGMSKKKLKKYSNNIFLRENKGFDAGAYKDVFLNFLKDEDWEQWDEVILCNDTFYGPIFPWKIVFNKMYIYKNIGFWGLSRYPGDEIISDEEGYPNHIQSYFLVCRKNLITSSFFWEFWYSMDYPKTRLEATRKFEINFSLFFAEKHIYGMAYTDLFEIFGKIQYKGSPYIYYVFNLLKEIQFPIIKRNALTITNFKKSKLALEYIKNKTNYNVNLIYVHLKRLAEEKCLQSINPYQLEKFYNAHTRVYIYGFGEYGQNIADYFEYKGWKYSGFIVSDNQMHEGEILQFDNVKFSIEDGVILALGTKAYQEVYPVVKKSLNANQIFTWQ